MLMCYNKNKFAKVKTMMSFTKRPPKNFRLPVMLSALIFAFLFLSCCANYPDSTGTTYIDEPIVLDTSSWVSAEAKWGGDFTADLSNIPMVQLDDFNDFEISYWTSSACDRNVWVYNFKTLNWDKIGFDPGPDIYCACVCVEQYHLFSARRLQAEDYLNERNHLKIRGDVGTPKVRALKINPGYHAVPLPSGRTYGFDGLTHDGSSFWVSSNWSDSIYHLSLTGRVIGEFKAPSEWPFGLAFDGSTLWLVDGSDQIFNLTPEGHVLCHFTVPPTCEYALTWAEGKLWMSKGDCPSLIDLFVIDPNSSCGSGSAVITGTMKPLEEGIVGLAWDGTHLLAVGQSQYGETQTLYKLTTGGEVVKSYELPVKNAKDIVWDGDGVWVINGGPKELTGRDEVITKFKLR